MAQRLLAIIPLALLTLGALLSGCAAPTLPLPPPAASIVAVDTDAGLVTVEGDAQEDAFVACVNENTDEGVVVRANVQGEFSLTIEAQPGDELAIWQRFGGDPSPAIGITVPEPR